MFYNQFRRHSTLNYKSPEGSKPITLPLKGAPILAGQDHPDPIIDRELITIAVTLGKYINNIKGTLNRLLVDQKARRIFALNTVGQASKFVHNK